MKARHHIMLSTMITIPYICTGDWLGAILVILFGVFIDVDHCLDYYLRYDKWTVSPTKLSNIHPSDEYNPSKHIYLFFHGFEWVIVLGIVSIKYPICIGAAVALFLHLLMDGTFNKIGFRDLWLCVRIKNGFVVENGHNNTN